MATLAVSSLTRRWLNHWQGEWQNKSSLSEAGLFSYLYSEF
ncbi:hypothetical protein [Shewanella livingstonensis]|nr:hypothetical protein [Shewanella livingstonensis]